MPPIVKTTKENIIDAAVEIIKTEGESALNARNLAKRLGCSTQPIFSNFNNMQDLKNAVIAYANNLYHGFLDYDMHKGDYPPYKASGMAYIRFAREERELFKLLFMRDRTGEAITEDREAVRAMLDIIMKNLGLDEDSAYMLHIELWVYVHGLATMIATGYLDWNIDFISRSLTDAYEGLKYRFTGA